MKKEIILLCVFILIAFILQTILVGTSPKIECGELESQFYFLLQSLIIQYLILICLKILILKFWIKSNFKKSSNVIIVFTIIFLTVFAYLFYGYSRDVCI